MVFKKKREKKRVGWGRNDYQCHIKDDEATYTT
jgi:hypothetical protein